MDIHVRRLSTFNILFGVFSLLASIALLIFFDGPMGMYRSTDDNILGLFITVSALAHLILAVPCLIGGLALRSLNEWSRGMLIVTSALNIINVPMGSVLGGYGLWVLLTPETDPLFAREPAHRVANKGVSQQASNVALQQKKAANTIVPSPRS
ncbi:MAG TPA: hypothetical protein VER03_02485 [Bryobacteraceae bacterium]|nr:hypothetical protein [Bryobacteraceae bacterium]